MRFALFVGISVCVFGIFGCKSEEKVPAAEVSKESAKPTEPPRDMTLTLTKEGSVEKITIRSIPGKFQVTLPKSFQGMVLTQNEIDRFCGALEARSKSVAETVRSQAEQLMRTGGAVFALNLDPADVTEGFADYMSIMTTVSNSPITHAEAVKRAKNDVAQSKPVGDVMEANFNEGGQEITELRWTVEGPGANGKPMRVSNLTYLLVQNRLVYVMNFATPESKVPKVLEDYRKSASSLKFD